MVVFKLRYRQMVWLSLLETRVVSQGFGSGDGEREESMTRQMPYVPVPASVLFGLELELADSCGGIEVLRKTIK